MTLAPRRTSRRGGRSALRDLLSDSAAGGVVLVAAAACAMIAANWSATATLYAELLHHTIGPVLGPAMGPMTIHAWINDGAMAVFFLLVGCEIKRELVDGGLARPSARRLPFLAAGAGMAAPALVYLALAGSGELARGWAIPAATDIAFAVGVLALLGSRVPPALKVFLTAVAIVDDMGAVAIIALVYSHGLNVAALVAAAGVLALMFALKRARERRLAPYLAGFVLLWYLVLLSGIHATVAGVLAAIMVPVLRSPGAPDAAASPLHRLEHALGNWVAFGIVPLFAFANAGVSLAGVGIATLAQPAVAGIALGLFLGKQGGILGAIWIAERIGIARRPGGATWMQMWGVALVAGIGFTMSLFIGGLAFPGDPLLADEVKIGVLVGSLLSALAGIVVLRLAPRKVR